SLRSSGLMPEWTGDAWGSTSRVTYDRAAGLADGRGALAVRSTAWADTGEASLWVAPLPQEQWTPHVVVGPTVNGDILADSTTYTLSVQCHVMEDVSPEQAPSIFSITSGIDVSHSGQAGT